MSVFSQFNSRSEIGPAFSGPAFFSSLHFRVLQFQSWIFRSCIFRYCIFLPGNLDSYFPIVSVGLWHIWSLTGPSFSDLTFSVDPVTAVNCGQRLEMPRGVCDWFRPKSYCVRWELLTPKRGTCAEPNYWRKNTDSNFVWQIWPIYVG